MISNTYKDFLAIVHSGKVLKGHSNIFCNYAWMIVTECYYLTVLNIMKYELNQTSTGEMVLIIGLQRY